MSKKLVRAIAALLAGLGVFAFAGCKNKTSPEGNGTNTEITNPGGNTGNNGGNTGDNGGNTGNNGGNTGDNGGNAGGDTDIKPPVIENKPITGAVKIKIGRAHV